MADTLSYICAAVEYTGQAKRVSAVLRPMLDALASVEAEARVWAEQIKAGTVPACCR